MKVHEISLTKSEFSWATKNQKEEEQLICEAFLKAQMPKYNGNYTFEIPKVDPPDIVINLDDGKTLKVEVTEYVPYDRGINVKANYLLIGLRKIFNKWKIYPPVPCNVVIGLKPELKRNIGQRKLLNQTEQLALKIKEFFETNDISNETRLLKISDGDVSISFIPALGGFKYNPSHYINNLNLTCWDGTMLERTRHDIKEIISHKDRQLEKALREKGEQCRTDALVIWCNIPPADGSFVTNIDECFSSMYSGIYCIFIAIIRGRHKRCIVGVETIQESLKELAFFTSINK